MPIETEKKYKIDKKLIVELTRRLEEVGAEFAYESFEENYLHRGGVLDERGAVLRLRKTREKTVLTYKEKAAAPQGEFKQQIEFETEVADVEATEAIIERLGYKLSTVYEKHRKAWHFAGTEVVLDELPFGYYMEIEGEIDAIRNAEKKLRIEHLELEPRGYPRLTAKLGKQVGDVIESRFKKSNSA